MVGTPGHIERAVAMDSGLAALRRPGMTIRVLVGLQLQQPHRVAAEHLRLVVSAEAEAIDQVASALLERRQRWGVSTKQRAIDTDALDRAAQGRQVIAHAVKVDALEIVARRAGDQ